VTSYPEYEPEEPRGWSPLAVGVIATLVLLLGLGGALFGIHVAKVNANPTTSPSTLPEGFPSRTTTPPVTTTPPTTTPPVTTSTSSPAPDGFVLPDVSGIDFQTARSKVRELKLGWRLVFEGTSDDATVRATDPPAGTTVRKGATVKIYVKGTAPLATVPNVVGMTCSDAAAQIVESGLYPSYPTGKAGTVSGQTPAASDPPSLHWNDMVRIVCLKSG
jgi:hypothetical protein